MTRYIRSVRIKCQARMRMAKELNGTSKQNFKAVN